MKVKQLLRKLKDLDPQMEIYCYCEDDDLLATDPWFRLLDILDVSVVDGRRNRTDEQTRTFKFGPSAAAQKHALIEVTSHF